MATVSINASKEKIEKMKLFYDEFKQVVNNPYIVFSAKFDGCVVNIYTTGKVTFQGEDSEDEALIWQDLEVEEEIKEINNTEWKVNETHIGSDEVGTGDFFGPIVVCACLVKKEDIPYLTNLGVTDSKKLSDEKIRELGKKLIEKLTYSSLVCDNETYNKQTNLGLNMNKIKAVLHNRALLNVIKKGNVVNPNIIVDQFAKEKVYYNYLIDIKDPVVRNINFKTKGETYAIAVACASIIARFRFLEKMDELSNKYKLGEIPKGASQLVDIFGQLFVKKYSLEELAKISKMNFKNVEKILNPLNKNL